MFNQAENEDNLELDNLENAALNNLAEAFENVNINMAQPNYQLLKLYVDTIAYYDGSPYTLNIFIESCENLIATFSQPGNDQLNQYILRAILSKLQGRALTLVGSRSLADWDSIKNALSLTFGDQRNIDCLVQDLIVLTPNKNETPYNFGMRCQDVRSLI